MKIKNKLIFFYSLIFLLTMLISIVVYQQIDKSIVIREMNQSVEETVQAVGQNIERNLEWINTYSRMTLANQDVQELLNATTEYDKLILARSVNRFTSEFITNFPDIYGIYIIDNNGEVYFANQSIGTVPSIRTELESRIGPDSQWYQEVVAARGAAVFKTGDGRMSYAVADKEYFTCARVINDINSQKSIGLLVVDFRHSMIDKAFVGLDDNEDRMYTLRDMKRNEIILIGGNQEMLSDIDENTVEGKYSIERTKWELEYIVDNTDFTQGSRKMSTFVFMIIILNSIILFLSSTWIASKITTPIVTLVKVMDEMEFGKLEEVTLKTSIPEFNILKDGYNRLVNRISQLLKNVIREQKKKRKAELDVLQAQIKPHFLYNTFDSISALALMKEYEKIYTITTSLGQFYRTSLNKGSELIHIRNEIELIENYVAIQEIRYQDMFKVIYEVDEDIMEEPILKLILQPFVENALYHGIKPKKDFGTITVRGYKRKKNIYFEIEDDGVGMSNTEVINVRKKSNKRSFGVRGTIERLRIFTGIDDVIKISSELGKGTKIKLKIPLERNKNHDEDDESFNS
ncbi:MAG: sensor histidine kinase [Clostridiales bacterium]|nr:sensor histidine kinase [Clostridiales bacterium]